MKKNSTKKKIKLFNGFKTLDPHTNPNIPIRHKSHFKYKKETEKVRGFKWESIYIPCPCGNWFKVKLEGDCIGFQIEQHYESRKGIDKSLDFKPANKDGIG